MYNKDLICLDGTKIEGPLLFTPSIFQDSRGFFFESWNQYKFNEILGESINFVQDNHSSSSKGVIRGLHFQKAPYEQDKLVRCISGRIYDVIVDLRKNSLSYKKWFGIELSAENYYQLWVPKGFAHGFLAVSHTAEILYKTTDYWNADSENTILWNDKFLDIKWPLKENDIFNPIISDKDKNGYPFSLIDKNKDL